MREREKESIGYNKNPRWIFEEKKIFYTTPTLNVTFPNFGKFLAELFPMQAYYLEEAAQN